RSGNSKVDGDVGPPQRVAGNQTGNNGQQEGHTYSAHLHRKEPLDAPSQGPQNAKDGSTFFAFLFLPSSGHIQGKSPQDHSKEGQQEKHVERKPNVSTGVE